MRLVTYCRDVIVEVVTEVMVVVVVVLLFLVMMMREVVVIVVVLIVALYNRAGYVLIVVRLPCRNMSCTEATSPEIPVQIRRRDLGTSTVYRRPSSSLRLDCR